MNILNYHVSHVRHELKNRNLETTCFHISQGWNMFHTKTSASSEQGIRPEIYKIWVFSVYRKAMKSYTESSTVIFTVGSKCMNHVLIYLTLPVYIPKPLVIRRRVHVTVAAKQGTASINQPHTSLIAVLECVGHGPNSSKCALPVHLRTYNYTGSNISEGG